MKQNTNILIDDLIKENETLHKIVLIIDNYKNLEKTVELLENKLEQINYLLNHSSKDLELIQLLTLINKIRMVADYGKETNK